MSGDRPSLIERWKQAMCSEHDAKLTMSNQGDWMCMSGGVHIVREPVWIDVVPVDQLRGAVNDRDALSVMLKRLLNVALVDGYGETVLDEAEALLARIEGGQR